MGIDRGEIETLAAMFRECPPKSRADFVRAGEVTGIDWRTAKRAYERGWRDQRALRDLMAEEQLLARAKLQKDSLVAERELAPLLAADDAATAAAREALVARHARERSLELLESVGALRGYVATLLQRLPEAAEAEELAPGEIMGRMRQAATVVREIISCAREALELERLRVGDPTAIIGIQAVPANVSLEETEAEIQAATRGLARATASFSESTPAQKFRLKGKGTRVTRGQCRALAPVGTRSLFSVLAQRIQLARRDANTFCEFVLRDEQTGRHQSWHDLIDEKDRLIISAHIEAGKSASLSVGRVLFELGKNPSARCAIVSNTHSQGSKLVRSVKAYIEKNSELHAVFPNLTKGSELWRDDSITVKRPHVSKDPSVVAYGLHGAVLGARIDFLVLDDILDYENTRTEAQRIVTWEWVSSTLLGRLTAHS